MLPLVVFIYPQGKRISEMVDKRSARATSKICALRDTFFRQTAQLPYISVQLLHEFYCATVPCSAPSTAVQRAPMHAAHAGMMSTTSGVFGSMGPTCWRYQCRGVVRSEERRRKCD